MTGVFQKTNSVSWRRFKVIQNYEKVTILALSWPNGIEKSLKNSSKMSVWVIKNIIISYTDQLP